MLSARRIAWVVGNAVSFVAVPALFAWWLQRLMANPEGFEPTTHDPRIAIAAFTVAWWIFLGGLNLTVALLLWLRSRDRAADRRPD